MSRAFHAATLTETTARVMSSQLLTCTVARTALGKRLWDARFGSYVPCVHQNPPDVRVVDAMPATLRCMIHADLVTD